MYSVANALEVRRVLNATSTTEWRTARDIARETGLSVQRVSHILFSYEHRYIEKRRTIRSSELKSKGRSVVQKLRIYEYRRTASII